MCYRRIRGILAVALVVLGAGAVMAPSCHPGGGGGGWGPDTFRVADAQKIPPVGLPGPGLKAMFNVTFNRPVNPATLNAPGSVKINVRNLTTNVVAANVVGVFNFNPQHTMAHFGSQLSLFQLVGLQPGQHPRYTIEMDGDQVRDDQGHKLDGKGNGHPGSNYDKVFNF